jgi:hypothetical protein
MTARRTIPTQRACHVCGIALTLSQRHYAEVSHCFVKMRAGGVHSITLPVYTGRFFCHLCLLKQEEGEQLELFGGDQP